MPGLVAGLLGCAFGTISIFALGLVFVPLAVVCAIIGFFRGFIGKSAGGSAISVLAGVLAAFGFITSPSLWLLAGAASLFGAGTVVTSQSNARPTPFMISQQRAASTPTLVPARDETGVCVREDAGHVIIERRTIRVGMGFRIQWYDAVVTARLDHNVGGGGLHIGAVAFTLFDSGTGCSRVYNQVIEGVESGRIETKTLGDTTLVHLIGVSFGASGNGYTHIFLDSRPDGLAQAIMTPLKHSNMGGLYVGLAGSGYGPGIVIWDAIWENETHYEPHRYHITFYPWTGIWFGSPQKTATSFKVDAEPGALPARLGWQGRDQTDQDRFARINPR